MQRASIVILLYRWAGHFGTPKITVPCGECSLSVNIIREAMVARLHHNEAKQPYRCLAAARTKS